MIQKIIKALKAAEIADYTINESKSESMECFFIRRNLDLKRRTNLLEYTVTVFCPFEKDGQKMLGSSSVQIYPEMEEDELEKTLRSAYHAASFVANPWYGLVPGASCEMVPADGGLAGRSLDECMERMTAALFAGEAEGQKDAPSAENTPSANNTPPANGTPHIDVPAGAAFLNSAEIFAKRILRRIVNSRGVDVGYETCEVSGEYVVQCVSPQDVETYHHFSYRDMDTEALRQDVAEALEMTRARAKAEAAPKAGTYRVILSGEQMRTFLWYYVSRSGAAMIYQKYSGYRMGAQIQGKPAEDAPQGDIRQNPQRDGKPQNPQQSDKPQTALQQGDLQQGDLLTITLKARSPYSDEGIPMKDRTLLEDGVLRTIHGDSRFAYYLGIEPTGGYDCISVPVGDMALSQMKSGAYLHIVSFSDFQMDSFSGHFGGEIRLAFLCDGQTVTPVTGGSMSGSILQVQDHMKFSKERYKDGNYEGPFAVSLEGIQISG